MSDLKYIQVIHGLEAIRRRPAMYIGEASAVRLLVFGLDAFVAGLGRREVESCEFELLADGGCAVRTAAALAPMGTSQGHFGIEQPEILREMLCLTHLGSGGFLDGRGAILTALSETAEVRCVAEGRELTAYFGRGGLIAPPTLTSSASHDYTVVEFLPDRGLLGGSADLADVQREWDRLAADRPSRIRVDFARIDRCIGEVPIRVAPPRG